MGKSGQIVGKFGRCDAQRLVAFLREQHPQKMPEAVEAATGVPAATVRKWPGSAPGFLATFRLIAAYGPELICACMDAPPAWADAAARTARQARLQADLAHLRRRLRTP